MGGGRFLNDRKYGPKELVMSDPELSKDDDYYPFRWKVADFFEDLFVLHRTAVVGVLALLGLGFILLGFLVLGWGQGDSTEELATEARTAAEGDNPAEESPTSSVANDGITTEEAIGIDTEPGDTETTSTTSSTTTSSTTTSSTTTSTTTTTTTVPPQSDRAATSDAQIAATPAGRVIVMNPGTIGIVGGLPTDEAADEVVELATALFPGFTIDDQQVVDDSFTDSDTVTLRLSAADLFGYNSDGLNSTYLPVIDQLAASLIENDSWTVEVSGHTDDTGPADGNQRLSQRRAAAAATRLTVQGVPSARVTSVGRGEDQPIESNDSEAGRLANRRVEFELAR